MSHEWRVSRPITALKGAGVVVAVLFALDVGGNGEILFGAAAVALAGLALRDLLAPVRLAADETGVTVVVGYAGRRRIGWPEVERIRVAEQRRLGRMTRLVEIDTGDTVHLLGRYDLNADCDEVVAELRSLRG